MSHRKSEPAKVTRLAPPPRRTRPGWRHARCRDVSLDHIHDICRAILPEGEPSVSGKYWIADVRPGAVQREPGRYLICLRTGQGINKRWGAGWRDITQAVAFLHRMSLDDAVRWVEIFIDQKEASK